MSTTASSGPWWCSSCHRKFASVKTFNAHATRARATNGGPDGPCFTASALLFAEHIARCTEECSPQPSAVHSERALSFGRDLDRHADSADVSAFLLESIAVRRYFKSVPVRHLEMEREHTKKLMRMVREELSRNLSPGMDEEQMSTCIFKACDVFRGIETTSKEESARLRDLACHGLTPVRAIRRDLLDQNAQPTGDVCYDLPIDATLEYMLQSRTDVWEHVQLSSIAWMNEGCERAGKECTVLRDLTDGLVFRSHPMLGDSAALAARAANDRFPRLKLIMYYDEVETVNAVGAFTGTHKIGLFYYALVCAAYGLCSECMPCVRLLLGLLLGL